ncbi:hypothetical protein [Cellulosimicrobium sp. Marseille-Q4280]|uniref:hypothetical protein n=1 Tax=Cellulosimicrobium sp. Marseille-Q4280 TaxID=2937992 RepID=UPI00203FA8BC|nr:hypothetical protein [Cellulosimicrobium sp. Marseille-Q4280]
MGLGINKDLEPLVRDVRRAGGTVEITKSTHVRWTLPDGTVLRSGLTMQGGNAQKIRRDIERALGIERHHKPKRKARPAHQAAKPKASAPQPRPGGRVEPAGAKFRVIGPDGEPLRNASGFPRTFSDASQAQAVADAL